MTIREKLKKDLTDLEYRHAYTDENLNLVIASQIRILREQQGLSQRDLAEKLGTKQAGVSRLESADYRGWSVRVLKKLAEAFDLRLRISFEEFGTLWREVENFSCENLQRKPFSEDPEFRQNAGLDVQPTVHSRAASLFAPTAPLPHAGAADQGVVSIDQSREWGGYRKPPTSALGNWGASGANDVGGSACRW